MGSGCDLVGDCLKMKLHGFAITGGQHEGSTGSTLGAYCAEQSARGREPFLAQR